MFFETNKTLAYFFLVVQILIYIFYVVAFFNMWNQAQYWTNVLHYVLQTLTGIILCIVFNPYIFTKYNNFHLYVAFSAGSMLLTSSILQMFDRHSIISDFLQKIDYRLKVMKYMI